MIMKYNLINNITISCFCTHIIVCSDLLETWGGFSNIHMPEMPTIYNENKKLIPYIYYK